MRQLLVLAAAAALLGHTDAVDRSKFRTCKDAGFCNRHRSKTAEPEMWLRPDTISLSADKAVLSAAVDVVGAPHLDLAVYFYESGIARIRLSETDGKPPRWESPDIVLESGTRPAPSAAIVTAADALVQRVTAGKRPAHEGVTYVHYTSKAGGSMVLALAHHPFKVDLYVDGASVGGVPAVSVNDRGLLYFEHRRVKGDGSAAQLAAAAGGAAASDPHNGGRKIVDWGEDGKPIYDDGSHGEHGSAHAHGAGDAPGQGAAGVDVVAAASADSEPGMWEETFQTHHDSKPFGPTSVGVDVTFPGATHVYGIPEHASTHALRTTDGSEGGAHAHEYDQPYRLYNLDVFEYELDNPMALYGSIPFMLAHGPAGHTAGVYWNNPTETYVDVAKGVRGSVKAAGVDGELKLGVATRWVSESGVWDLSLVPGPAPKAVVAQYASLTGTQALPPLFALGYHQCRWNYKDEADVLAVDAKFEEHAFPYDVIWLDIEHTDGKRYFTWDSRLFPHPADMQDKLAARGHKMVTIIDPHIKRDAGYRVHSDAQAKGLYTRNAAGAEYDGWCWPGSSSYLDFTNPTTRDWWAEQFSLANYPGSTLSLYTWNDMNEPSVFNGPEVSMNKDAKSIDGVEHREWHNLYGFYQQMATAEGQVRRSPGANTRPFVLSRAFFAGSQRHGAIWTGDNAAKWEHLAAATPMLLTIGAAGLTFAGADVGGFFNNPSTELMTRWYQAGAFQPFFRAHAHIDTARREPWLFGDEVLSQLRDIVRTRYTYLPLWYTLFRAANESGAPTMRPLWMEFPGEPATFGIEDQWLVGSDLLVKPVTAAGVGELDVYFPGADAVWYDALTFETVRTSVSGGVRRLVSAPLTKIPVYQRGGAIVPRQMRPRRSSAQMAADPYTLVVTLDAAKSAEGELYLDDGASFDYARRNAFRVRRFRYAPEGTTHALRSASAGGGKTYAPANTVERIVIAGLGRAPAGVTAVDGSAVAAAAEGAVQMQRRVAFDYDAATDVLTLRKPDVKVAYDWAITLTF